MSRRRETPFHAFLCRTDGGTKIHGRRGFWCPRCAQLDEDDREFTLLRELDRYAGDGR